MVIKEFPSSHRTIRIFSSPNTIPLLGSLFSLLLLVQSLFRENNWFELKTKSLWISTHIVDPAAATALLSAFVSLAFLRSQFLYSSMPVFDYRIQPWHGRISVTDAEENEKLPLTQVVHLHNSGLGVGIVTKASYWIEEKNPNDLPSSKSFIQWFEKRGTLYGNRNRYKLDFHEVKEWMAARGWVEDKDWAAINFGPGSAFGPGVKRRIMVLSDELSKRLVAFDLLIEYQSALGDAHTMEMFMVPRRQF